MADVSLFCTGDRRLEALSYARGPGFSLSLLCTSISPSSVSFFELTGCLPASAEMLRDEDAFAVVADPDGKAPGPAPRSLMDICVKISVPIALPDP